MELTDRSTALRYAQALCHADDPIVTLQAFGDRKQRDLAAIRAGTISQVWPWVCDRQRAGCGIFATVQATRHGFRKASDVTGVRAQFVEFDGQQSAPQRWHIQPSIIVRSRNGLHAYWLTSDATIDGYRERQQRLAAFYGSDPVVHDLPRVLRLPGTWHQKAAPFLVQLVHCDRHDRYTTAAIMAQVPELPQRQPQQAPQPPPHGAIKRSTADYSKLDAVALFSGWGLYLAPTRRDGQHAVACPWGAEHTGGLQGHGDTVIWESDSGSGGRGWPSFFCAHAHCRSRRMIDVIRLLPPETVTACCTR